MNHWLPAMGIFDPITFNVIAGDNNLILLFC
jgi:hypothetical protein